MQKRFFLMSMIPMPEAPRTYYATYYEAAQAAQKLMVGANARMALAVAEVQAVVTFAKPSVVVLSPDRFERIEED